MDQCGALDVQDWLFMFMFHCIHGNCLWGALIHVLHDVLFLLFIDEDASQEKVEATQPATRVPPRTARDALLSYMSGNKKKGPMHSQESVAQASTVAARQAAEQAVNISLEVATDSEAAATSTSAASRAHAGQMAAKKAATKAQKLAD